MKIKNSIFKIMTIILIALFINIVMFGSGSVNAIIKANDLNDSSENVEEVKPILASVLEITSIIASATSIVVLIILGIKYMMGSIEEKATYKKTLFPYVIGAMFVFGASTIASFLFKMF